MESLLHLMEDEKILRAERLDVLRRVGQSAKNPAYVVGGFVRDLLLRKPVSDFDIVSEGDAIAFARSLAKQYGGQVTAHANFGTAKWFLNENSFVDFITARSEIYTHNAALPTVKFASLSEDILRRDFTINTLAIRLDGNHFGEVRDDINGQADIKKGIVRVLHSNSFLDDPTRIYRAVRYEQRYGFKIDVETAELIPEAIRLIEKLSAQRIRHELDLILDEPNAHLMIARLADLNLLKSIHPALSNEFASISILNQKIINFADLQIAIDNLNDIGVSMPRRDFLWLLWLMPLSADSLKSLNTRLSFTANLMKLLLSGSELLKKANQLSGLSPSKCVQFLDTFHLESVAIVYLLNQDAQIKNKLYTYLHSWRHIKANITGVDLKARGVPAGPKYNEILWKIRAAWLDGIVNDKTQEANLLMELLEIKL